MILTDYFTEKRDLSWDYARQCGVENAVIRLPETKDFDITDFSHWRDVCRRFADFGLKPLVVEPLPNELHNHIKLGDEKRDESIEKAIKMLAYMKELGITTLCFNWMAHIGWLRTDVSIPERGGALVTGFDLKDFAPGDECITAEKLWDNYTYFVKAVVPYAEKYGIRLALHPDDPPISKLGGVARIMTGYDNIQKALDIAASPCVGATMCQACYVMMGEDLSRVIPKLASRIYFVHFRNVRGNKESFRETFHDNGVIDMAEAMRMYKKYGVDVPIRVDHVPLMAGESQDVAGYTPVGRLFAIGYLKGLMDACDKE